MQEKTTALSLSQKYPSQNYNLLGNSDVMAVIPDIKSPVIQVIRLSANPDDGEVYIQKKGNPPKYAITKNGLKKLADGAGIKMVSSEHVVPTTCQKCVAVNANAGKMVRCGECNNKDVAYRVTISVPQLTGDVLTVEDTHEIIVENTTVGMTPAQKVEFMKHLPQICEAKALNGAIRTALHIKGTYTKEELAKPFVVAYLVPNLNHSDVKKYAIESMFQSSMSLFGSAPTIKSTPSVQQIESKVPETAAIEASDGEVFDQYVDGTYQTEEVVAETSEPEQERTREDDFQCDQCGCQISEKVWNYSVEKFGRPLCYKHQQEERAGR